MELVLEVRKGAAGATRHPLGRARYVLGSNDASSLGEMITVPSNRVKPNHAILEYTPDGWFLTPKQQDVRLDAGRQLLVNQRRRLASETVFRIADVDFRLIPVEGGQGAEDGAGQAALAFDELTSEVQRRSSQDTERRAAEGTLAREEPLYRQKILPIVDGHLAAALARVPQADFQAYAAEALRREIVLRLLGHPGLFADPLGGDVTASDRGALDRLARELLGDMGLDLAPAGRPAKLARLRAAMQPAFEARAMTFSRALLDKLVAEAARFAVIAAMDGIGPLEALMAIEDVNEVMVVGHDKVFVEIDGKLVLTSLSFRLPEEALTIAQKIALRSNTSVEKQHPYRDARLPDGSRVNLVIDPIALSGTTITIRKFRARAPDLLFLRRKGSLSSPMASFLKGCVVSKKNMLVAGGTGTGKTTFVNFLASMIPEDERIVTVEDTAELKVSDRDGGRLPHVVTLQGVAPTGDSRGHTIRDLVHNALRMRPDRIIVGECRGGEAFDMLQAMNTGHEGSMTTLHANDPVETVARLENLVLSAGEGLPLEAIRYQVAAAIDFIVQLRRYADGAKKVAAIAEVGHVDPMTGRVEVNPIFETHYNPVRPGAGARFAFAGRTPEAIREIIDGGFDPRRLRF